MKYAGRGWCMGQDGGGKKRGQNTIKQVKRERKRQRQHLKAHQKARKTTSEHTKHISPRSINTRTRTHTYTGTHTTNEMALPAKKASIKVISVGKSCSHLISKFIHQCRGCNRVTACARLGSVAHTPMCKGPGVVYKRGDDLWDRR